MRSVTNLSHIIMLFEAHNDALVSAIAIDYRAENILSVAQLNLELLVVFLLNVCLIAQSPCFAMATYLRPSRINWFSWISLNVLDVFSKSLYGMRLCPMLI